MWITEPSLHQKIITKGCQTNSLLRNKANQQSICLPYQLNDTGCEFIFITIFNCIWFIATHRINWCNKRRKDHDNGSPEMEDRDTPLQRVGNPDPCSSSPCIWNIGPTMFHSICMSSTSIYKDIWTRYIRGAAFVIICSTGCQKECISPYDQYAQGNLKWHQQNLSSHNIHMLSTSRNKWDDNVSFPISF